jgi:hypothetical protein
VAISVSRKQDHRVTIKKDGGEFTAVLRSLKGRQGARASVVFARLHRKMQGLATLLPEPKRQEGEEGEGGKPVKIDFGDLTAEQQDAVLELSADMLDDMIMASAIALKAVEGIEEAGKPLVVPDGFEARQVFLDEYFEFPELFEMASAVINANTVTEKDAGN